MAVSKWPSFLLSLRSCPLFIYCRFKKERKKATVLLVLLCGSEPARDMVCVPWPSQHQRTGQVELYTTYLAEWFPPRISLLPTFSFLQIALFVTAAVFQLSPGHDGGFLSFFSHCGELFWFLLLTLFTSLPQAIRDYVVCLHYWWLLYLPRLIDMVTEDRHANSNKYAKV